MINKILQNSITSNNVKIYMENDKLNFSINDTHYLTDDINYWVNQCAANYYGIESISVAEIE